MSYYLYLLNKQRLVFKSDLLKLLIESLVLSHLIYCLPVWGPPLTVNRLNLYSIELFGFVWAFKSMITFHNITMLYSGYLWEVREIQYHSLCAMHHQFFQPQHILLYHQFNLVTNINMRQELLNSLLSHLDVNFLLLNVFFCYKVIHWWNAVLVSILTSAAFKDILFLHICEFL